MSTDKHTQLLDDLQSLLEQQINLARQGNAGGVEVLGEQANCLVEEIAQTGILESSEFKSRRERLQGLYEELCLAITAQKADVSEKLTRARQGRKVIVTYRNNIRP